jgi:hypothetical protein
MPSAKEVVEAIQRDRGLDVLNEGTPGSRSRNLRDLGNALKLLSDQLYKSDGHFLLELLQNADDNAYPEGSEPAAVIEVSDLGLAFKNNEIGFSDANVEAVCSIGESTKKNQKNNAIGEKGIGFKAVFKISNRPEVHSGPYHFCFDRVRNGDLGLVTPIWLDNPNTRWCGNGTAIVLPYKAGYKPANSIQAQVRPELLLFLRRLRRIRCVDVVSGEAIELARRDQGPLVEVIRTSTTPKGTSTATFRYFLHRKVVRVDDLADDLRVNVTHTEVVIAVPVGEDGTVDGKTARHLFAYLPIRESGLRFVAHADFILTTSREDIMPRPWNVRLRDELGVTLAEAVTAMQAHGALGRSALRLLCKPSTLADTFVRPILDKAITALKASTCIPTVGGAWSLPQEALRPDSGKLSELIPDEDYSRLLGRSLFDTSEAHISEALDILKVEKFQLEDLLRACGDSAWLGARTVAWFADLYHRLEPISQEAGVVKQLRSAAVLRLGDGRVVSAEMGSVFRSLSRKVIYGFEHGLLIVDAAVLDAAKATSTLETVNRLFDRLKVPDADPTSVIDHHILPLHRSESWKEADDSVLFGHVRYVRDHLDTYLKSKADRKNTLDDLRASLWIYSAKREGDTRIVSRANELYVGDTYGDLNRLQWLFSGSIDNDVISSEYATENSSDERSKDLEAWKSFFRQLGSHTLPRIRSSTNCPNHIKPPQLRGYSLVVADWLPAAELTALAGLEDAERKTAFLELLDGTWQSYWSKYSLCTATRGYKEAHGCSSVLATIRGMSVKDSRDEWVTLAGLYQPTEHNRAVFGPSVKYLSRQLSTPELVAALNVVAEPTVQQVLTRLTELSRDLSGDKKTVTKLYQFLDQHWEGHGSLIGEHFRAHKLVCIGFGETTLWATLEECCWALPYRLREIAPIHGLVGIWQQLGEFFCDKLDVRRSMSREEWATTLLKLSDVELEPGDAGTLARQVYRELEAALNSDENAKGDVAPEWITPVVKGQGIWTTREEWWRNDRDVFANDDPSLAELFRDSERVAFISLTPSELPQFSRLLSVLGIRRISDADREPSGEGQVRGGDTLAARLQSRWVAIARLLYFLHNDCYEDAKADHRLRGLKEVKVSVWEPLKLEVVLGGERRKRRFECKLRENSNGLELLVDFEERDNWLAIGLEVGRWLGLADSASFPLGNVLGASDDAGLEKVFRSLRVYELPADELELLNNRAPLLLKVSEGIPNPDDPPGAGNALELHEAALPPPDSAKRPAVPSEGQSQIKETEKSGVSAPGSDAVGLGEINDSSPAPAPTGIGPRTSDNAGEGSPSVQLKAAAGTPDSDNTSVVASKGESLVIQSSNTEESTSGKDASDINGSLLTPTPTVVEPPTKPDAFKTGKRKPQRSPGRLISYVTPLEGTKDSVDVDKDAQQDRDRVDQSAIDYVVLKESSEQRRAVVKEHSNPGYDIESYKDSNELDRYIEVKGLTGAWGERGVTMSSTQFDFVRQHRDRSWLYVVEFADDPVRRKLWRIQDPASKASHFGFDHGWQAMAELAEPINPNGIVLKEGVKWRCEDGVIGMVVSVTRSPSFVSIRVNLPDGTILNRSGPERRLLLNIVGD